MAEVMIGVVAPIVRDGTVAPATPIYRDIPNAPEDPTDLYPFERIAEYFAEKYFAHIRALRRLENNQIQILKDGVIS